jgi:hypothetical protein
MGGGQEDVQDEGKEEGKSEARKRDVPDGNDRFAVSDDVVEQMRARLSYVSSLPVFIHPVPLDHDEYMRAHNTSFLGQLIDKAQRLHHRVAQFLVRKSPGLGVFELYQSASAAII